MSATPRTDAFVARCNARSSVGAKEAVAFARELEVQLEEARRILVLAIPAMKLGEMDHIEQFYDFLKKTNPP